MTKKRYGSSVVPVWDEGAGIWATPSHGHTLDTRDLETVHSIPIAAWKMVHAGMTGSLQDVPVVRVLENIRSVQELAGEQKGCVRWFLEDAKISDTNAAFFTGFGLIVLHHEYAALIGRDAQAIVNEILGSLSHWFARELENLDERNLRYPNKCLGDMVCAWLIAEITGGATAELAATLDRGFDYYLDKEWGWGEHISDPYGKMCMDELVALAVYARSLPAALAKKAEQLLTELLQIDALFGGGPRVPTIRCYAFDTSPRTAEPPHHDVEAYLEQMRPVNPAPEIFWSYFIRNIAGEHGMRDRFRAVAPACGDVSIPCYGGAEAQARVLKNTRLGAMTRYPIMDGIDQQNWGLAWQSFPVAFWHAAGDWGFLQWEAEEGGRKRAHPANTRFHRNGYTLSDVLTPRPLGQTRSKKWGDGFLVHRRMPGVSPEWPFLTDRFRMIDATVPRPAITEKDGWRVATIRFDTTDEGGARDGLLVAYHPLSEPVDVGLAANPSGGWDLDVRYRWDAANLPAQLEGIWYIRLGDGAFHPPPLPAAENWL